MPGKKRYLPERKTFTDKMPAIKISDVAPGHPPPAPMPPHDTSAGDARFEGLHARFDTLESLIRESFAAVNARLDNHEARISALERKKGK